MKEPIPVLYVDINKESQEAETILRNAKIDFQRILIGDPVTDDVVVPQILSSRAFCEGLEDIRWYARVYGAQQG